MFNNNKENKKKNNVEFANGFKPFIKFKHQYMR